MKKINFTSTLVIAILSYCIILQTSCRKNLLDQLPTTELSPDVFWKTEADATAGLMGLYSSARPCWDRDYNFDGQAEFVRARGTSATVGNLRLGDAYQSSNTGGMYGPTNYGALFDNMYKYLYGVVNRANYVIFNVNKMQSEGSAASTVVLETIKGEAALLRGMAYFKLISMWGDVPYFTNVVYENSAVSQLARTPIGKVKDSILADFA